MADEEKAPEGAEEKKKKSPVILVAILVVVGLALAGGISFFVTTQMMSNAPAEEVDTHHDPGVFVKLGDAKEGILVNVGGQKAGKFLKCSIVLEMNPGKKSNMKEGVILPEAETKILDTTMQMLRSAKLDELKKKLKDELNDRLGQGSVYDVYITSFLLQ